MDRKQFIRTLGISGAVISLFPQTVIPAEISGKLTEILIKAGNSNNEKERAQIFQQALKISGISEEEKLVLEKLFFISDRWANGFEKYANPGSEGNEMSGYLCGFINKCKIDRYFFPQLEESDPFFPLIAFYRSRMLLAHLIQNGNISMVPENREIYINESLRLLEKAVHVYPENELIKAYLGDYKPWEELVPVHSKAPDWANHQRMTLAKLTYLIHWWVDNRQISDGQFGGGWGDDVEMWRSWVPVLFAFDDEKAVKSQEKLFEGLYGLSRMEKGYTTFLNDVEHTSEEYADPLTCMMNMQPDNPVWEQRTLKVLDYIENSWTGLNQRGRLQFKSTWFNVDKVDQDEKRACDSPYHTRLVQPLMLIWLRTGNERIGSFMKSWLKTWVHATFTEESGKPNGIVPAAIHWPEGKPTGGKNWWQPENYHTPLYHYPSQQENMYECFLQAYHITKDTLYLEPIRFIADQRLQGMGDKKPENYTPGSLEWAISELKGSFPGILIKYRLITGDKSYDLILENDAGGYERFVFDKNVDSLTKSMDDLRKSLSLPEEFFTGEVRWTDRLFAVTKKYFNYIQDEPIPSFNAGFLFSSLTGNLGNFKILPVFGVKWLTNPNEIAILTETNSTHKFEAQLFHFGQQARKMGARFYNLEEGQYQFKLTGGKVKEVNISDTERDVEFELPEQKLVRFVLEKK
ncbi:hypothetical protein N9164_04435 [Draconibacterium sp.]|nr:hypothetical protein [Draconibacterium sp.]